MKESKTDAQLQNDVTNEFQWDPRLSSEQVSVTARDGIVTLRGSVPHYLEKSTAEAAAQRVAGVRAVADEIEVKLMGAYERTDEDIARAAIHALEWNYSVPKDVHITVTNGWVTLSGEVPWDYQRNAAKDSVSELMGVCGVTNKVTIKPTLKPADVQTKISEALKRSAESEGRHVHVSVDGGHVTLSGDVHSLSERNDAQFAAWNAPGVLSVENNLKLTH